MPNPDPRSPSPPVRSCERCQRPHAVPPRNADDYPGVVTLDRRTHMYLCNACWFVMDPGVVGR